MLMIMPLSKLWTVVAFIVATCAEALEIQGTVNLVPDVAVKQIEPLRVQLNGGEQTTFVRADGSFQFRDVAPGRYVVDIPSTTFLFSRYKVDVAVDGLVRAVEYKYVGAPTTRTSYPLVVEPVKQLEYFEQREQFHLLGLVMNPSFLTIVVPIALLYVLPKLTEGMGESRKERRDGAKRDGLMDHCCVV